MRLIEMVRMDGGTALVNPDNVVCVVNSFSGNDSDVYTSGRSDPLALKGSKYEVAQRLALDGVLVLEEA